MRATLVALMLFTLGCAHREPVWMNPDGNWSVDSGQCEAAKWQAFASCGAGGVWCVVAARRTFDGCMQGKGWHLE